MSISESQFDELKIDRWNFHHDHDAVYDLYIHYEKFMNYLVHKRFRTLSEQIRDLDPIFNRAFYYALQKYNKSKQKPGKKFTFIGYLTYVVKNQLRMMRREERKLNGQVSFTNASFVEPSDTVSMNWVENAEFLSKELDKLKFILSDRELEIVRLKFGEREKNIDIANRFKVTPQAISFSLKRILEKIRISTEQELQDRLHSLLA